MATEEPKHVITNEEAARSSRWIGTVILLVGLAVAYWIWPAGVIDTPLAQLTFGHLLRAIASVGVALGGLFIAVMLWM